MKKSMKIYKIIFFIFAIQNSLIQAEFVTLEGAYDCWATDYKALMTQTNYKIADWFIGNRHLLPDKHCLVLDLGCADGSTGETIAQYRPQYNFVGIDFSQHMVENCLEKSMYTKILKANLSNGLPNIIVQQKYDIIIATGCLEFIQNHHNLFQEIADCLNDGGFFWLTLAAKEDNSVQHFLDTQITHYTLAQARDLIEATGFTIINFEINPCAYITSTTQQSIPYFMIIAQKSLKIYY
jgi:predicted TPR repeat methyltransferase